MREIAARHLRRAADWLSPPCAPVVVNDALLQEYLRMAKTAFARIAALEAAQQAISDPEAGPVAALQKQVTDLQTELATAQTTIATLEANLGDPTDGEATDATGAETSGQATAGTVATDQTIAS